MLTEVDTRNEDLISFRYNVKLNTVVIVGSKGLRMYLPIYQQATIPVIIYNGYVCLLESSNMDGLASIEEIQGYVENWVKDFGEDFGGEFDTMSGHFVFLREKGGDIDEELAKSWGLSSSDLEDLKEKIQEVEE